MGTCNIDHTQADVVKKLDSQWSFLPGETADAAYRFLKTPRLQTELNELFHLLKKYDLAPQPEQIERNEKIHQLVS